MELVTLELNTDMSYIFYKQPVGNYILKIDPPAPVVILWSHNMANTRNVIQT